MKSWQRKTTAVLVVVVLALSLSTGLLLVVNREGQQVEILPVARGSEDYGWLKVEEVVLTATGAHGSASGTGSTDRPVRGHVFAVHLDFSSTISTTTDITLTQAAPALTVLQLTNYYTDTWYYPSVEWTDSSGSGRSVYDQFVADDQIDFSISETTSSTTILTATIYWGE